MYDDRKGNRDKGRMSWKEIDALRDKSRTRDRDPMQKQSSPAAMNAQKNYRAALERAFANGTVDELAKTLTRQEERVLPSTQKADTPKPPPPAAPPPPTDGAATAQAAPAPAPVPEQAPKDPERDNRMKMLARIREAEGRDPITKAIDAFLAKFPKLPDDFEVLTKVLSHKNDDRIRDGLTRIEALLGREKPRRGRTLLAQLRFLEDTHTDPEIRTQAAQVRGRL